MSVPYGEWGLSGIHDSFPVWRFFDVHGALELPLCHCHLSTKNRRHSFGNLSSTNVSEFSSLDWLFEAKRELLAGSYNWST